MSYEQDAAWAPYYAEVDPGKREKLYYELTEDGHSFRRQLFQERHQDPKHPARRVDLWLWKCVYLPGLYRKRWFFRRSLQKEMRATLKELHLDRPLTAEESAALYWEFRNTARRYLDTCRSSDYGNSFFGLKKASEEEKRLRACEDVWMMTRGLARMAGLETEMRLWCDAFYAELLEFDPEAGEYFKTLDAGFKG